MNVSKYFKDRSGISLEFFPSAVKLSTGELIAGYTAVIDEDSLCIMCPLRLLSSITPSGVGYSFTDYDPMTFDVFQMINRNHIVSCNGLKKDFITAWEGMVMSRFERMGEDAKPLTDTPIFITPEKKEIH